MNYEKLNQDALKCMYIGSFIFNFIFIAIISFGYFNYYSEMMEYFNHLNVAYYILLIFLILNLIISPYFRYKRYKYVINDEKIDVKEGFLWVKRVIVPISRIHKITLKSGPIDSLFKLSTVVITTAGGEASIKFLKLEKAMFISEKLKSKINEKNEDL